MLELAGNFESGCIRLLLFFFLRSCRAAPLPWERYRHGPGQRRLRCWQCSLPLPAALLLEGTRRIQAS